MTKPENKKDRWDPARRLMSGQDDAKEYKRKESSYKTDYETGLRKVAKTDSKPKNPEQW